MVQVKGQVDTTNRNTKKLDLINIDTSKHIKHWQKKANHKAIDTINPPKSNR
jgi:hypothetical protein